MPKVEIINHRGKNIVYTDLANAGVADFPSVLEDATKAIVSNPQGSVLTVTDVTDAKYNRETVRIMNNYVAFISPYLKAGAVVGVTGLKKVVYDAIMQFYKVKYPLFATVEQACDWLVEQ